MASLRKLHNVFNSRRPGNDATKADKYPAHLSATDESSIPLLPTTMAADDDDDKIVGSSTKVTGIRRHSETSSSDIVIVQEKAPWWSYIWVSVNNSTKC